MRVSAAGTPALEIVDEPTYSFGSVDNVRRYFRELSLQSCGRPTSVHGIVLDGVPTTVIGAGGGATCVHSHSALLSGNRLYLAVGDHLACLSADDGQLIWATRVDEATCLGIHYEKTRDALICHGELSISRICPEGKLLWSRAGADIFTGGCTLDQTVIRVEDFNGRKYCLSYEHGQEV